MFILGAVSLQAQRSDKRVDPPGFGAVTLGPGQTIRLNATCFDDQVGSYPPSPCHGMATFTGPAGETLKQAHYDLDAGASVLFEYMLPRVNPNGTQLPIPVTPGLLPEAGGPVVPSVEVFDIGGGLMLFQNPASPRMSEFNSAFTNPSETSGFNAQPDPPGFGLVTLIVGQSIRSNVSCFAGPVDGFPPGPCRGTAGLNSASGDVLARVAYDLQPGQTTSFTYTVSAGTPNEIQPCFTPAPGGRAVPNVEVLDVTGNTLFLIGPAAARMSLFQQF
jgi:hypothetical protein